MSAAARGAARPRHADRRAADPLPWLLLDLLAPVRAVTQAQVDALPPEAWRRLLDMARQHRVVPLLHWQLGHAHAALRLPAEVTDALAAAHRAAALRSLQLQRELLLTHALLADAGIPHMALKGAALTWHVYPHPALRPMRDLDILVPVDAALRAYDVLLAGGLTRKPGNPGDPASMLRMHQHLPPLRSASGTVIVELHGRLSAPDAAIPDPSESSDFWARADTIALGGAGVQVTSPTDLLLHLIAHAAYDHEFTNGPLVLSDLAFLLERHPIDWPLFWALARQGGQVRGCVLALTVMQRYWGARAIDWQGHERQDDGDLDASAELAAELMLRDFDARFDVNLHAELAAEQGLAGKLGRLLRKVFPPRVQVAATYPVSADDPRVFLWYPVRWYRLAFERMPMFLRAARSSTPMDEATRLGTLRRWLHTTGTAD